MNKALIFGTALASATLLQSLPATAAETANDESTFKQDVTFTTSAVVGAVTGGPVGFILGALGGGWAAAQMAPPEDYAMTVGELKYTQQQVSLLEQQLSALKKERQQLAQLALEQLQLEMLFTTGNSELTNNGKNKLVQLAEFLQANPEISVRLDGYADPRGDEKFNMSLSQSRATAVANGLIEAGVDESRINIYAHGAKRSQASAGDLDAYALERVVRIELGLAQEHANLAQVDLVAE